MKKILLLLCLIGGATAHAQILQPSNGGTGQDSSAWTGCVGTTAGVWNNFTCVAVNGTSDVTAQSTSQATTTLIASAATTAFYRISYYADQNGTCGTGANSVFFSFQWTDPTHARTANSVALPLPSSQSANLGSIQGTIAIYVESGAAITYTSTINGSCSSGTSSYDVHVVVETI